MHGGLSPFCFDATLEQWLFLAGGGTKSIPIAWTLGLGPGRKKSALQVDKQREQLISPLMFSHFCCRFVLSLFLFSASNASFSGRESPGLKSALWKTGV